MDQKSETIDQIISAMMLHLDFQNLQILNEVLTNVMSNVQVTNLKKELITIEDTNHKILELFKLKKSNKLSNSTIEQYIRHVNLLITMINKPLTLMEENDIEYFLLMYKKREVSNCTVNNCKRYLSAFFTWLRKSKMIFNNPVENIDDLKHISKPIEHIR